MHLFRRRRSNDARYLADVTTMFGRTLIYDVRHGHNPEMRVLDVEGTWQSACFLGSRADDLAFAYHRRFVDVLAARPRPVQHALMLGGGGYAFPAWLLTHDATLRIDVVEIDPAITRLAGQWLSLSRLGDHERARLRIFSEDAIDFIDRTVRNQGAAAASEPYDLVVNDLFAAERPASALMDPVGMGMVRSLLTPDGLYLANVVSALKGSRSRPLSSVIEAVGHTFADMRVISLGADEPRAPDNNIVIASDADLSWLD